MTVWDGHSAKSIQKDGGNAGGGEKWVVDVDAD